MIGKRLEDIQLSLSQIVELIDELPYYEKDSRLPGLASQVSDLCRAVSKLTTIVKEMK